MLSLSFALGVAALCSFLIVRLTKKSSIKVEFNPDKQRLFKHERLVVNSMVTVKGRPWVSVKLCGLRPPLGIDTQVKKIDGDSIEISIEPNFAGRYRGIEIMTEVSDPLDLFKKEVNIPYDDFTVDSLPASLAIPIPKLKSNSLNVGEISSRLAGGGVELYALDEYRPFGETKNILWKRVARMPVEKLVVRVRESNIPEAVTIGFIHRRARREPEDRIRFMDRVCEGIGLLGNNLIAIGCLVEIIYTSLEAPEKVVSKGATEIMGLAGILMEMWDAPSERMSEEEILEILLASDVVVTGFSEMQDEELAGFVSKRLSLLIKEKSRPPVQASDKSVVYSGVEDLRKLAFKVVER